MSRINHKLRSLHSVAALVIMVAASLVCAQLVFAAPGDPDFQFSPATPSVGERVTFTASNLKPGDSVAWDFDYHGTFSPDATGTTVQHAYATSGDHKVLMRVTRTGRAAPDVIKSVRVNPPPPPLSPPNQAPLASFSASPNPAEVGQVVQFNAAGSSDPDGTVASYAWDLDDDGEFDDASGVTASRSFAAAGTYTVRLRAIDNRGSSGTATSAVTVSNAAGPPANQAPVASFTVPALRLMTPFPVVRIIGRLTRSGTRIRLLRVRGVPRGAFVTVRCRGAGCRRRRQSVQVSSGTVRLRSFERNLRVGARIQVFIIQPGRIGKYTSFRIRSRRAPLRKDLCVLSGRARPTPCPVS